MPDARLQLTCRWEACQQVAIAAAGAMRDAMAQLETLEDAWQLAARYLRSGAEETYFQGWRDANCALVSTAEPYRSGAAARQIDYGAFDK